MSAALIILLILSVLLIFHSYVLYPILLQFLSKNKSPNTIVYDVKDELPRAAVLMAVYNEEKVIAEKLQSILNSEYPKSKLEILIGSDASTDQTDEIITQFSEQADIQLTKFSKRSGKVNIINQLAEKASAPVLIITDANVLFEADTVFELVKHFKNQGIALVDSHMNNTGIDKKGISLQERSYIKREVNIKHLEGLVWGTMMGPFGGCYAVRKSYFEPVPGNYLVDDFYVNMKVLEKGGKAINELNANVFEDVSNEISEEFRRKIRIATGNYQNLASFLHLLKKPFSGLGFSFLSHKVIRWTGPFLICIAYLTNLLLTRENSFFKILFISQSILLLLPIVDLIFRKLGVHSVILRFITHFYAMNLALLAGFIRFLKGVETNVWKPTKRKQHQA